MYATKQILFVDDDELILSCFERLFGNRFAVQTALGGEKAMEALKLCQFAVVASDMRMPGMNGIELLKKVKETFPETVAILLTGNPELGDGEDSAGGGLCFKLLSKPCPTDELIAAFEEALEQYRVNTQVRNE